MLIYFVECFIMGFALGLSWASFATPVYLICCFAGWVFDWKIPTAYKTSFEVNKPPCAASAGRLLYVVRGGWMRDRLPKAGSNPVRTCFT